MTYTIEQAKADGWGDRAEDFAYYRNAVDDEVTKICGMGLDDLPDYDVASAFEDGESPRDVAEAVLEYAGFPMDLLN